MKCHIWPFSLIKAAIFTQSKPRGGSPSGPAQTNLGAGLHPLIQLVPTRVRRKTGQFLARARTPTSAFTTRPGLALALPLRGHFYSLGAVKTGRSVVILRWRSEKKTNDILQGERCAKVAHRPFIRVCQQFRAVKTNKMQ